MHQHQGRRSGSVNPLYLLAIGSLGLIAILVFFMSGLENSSQPGSGTTVEGDTQKELFLYCAAGIRPPVVEIVKKYEKEYGVKVQLQYGGSNTLLNQIEIAKTGDLYIAGDDSYVILAQEKGLVEENIPLALMRPVIAVKKGNPKNIQAVDDLLKEGIRVAAGNPDQAAIGRKTRKLLNKSGHWEELNKRVTDIGVFKPTVPEVANDVKIGSVDAGIIWDATVAQYDDLESIRTPELDAGTAKIAIGVLTSSKDPTAALHFARYLSSREKGLSEFEKKGFEIVQGDKWVEEPELTFYVGTVNRRAIEETINSFSKREGVRVNTVYNGCGILTAQMRTIQGQQQGLGFPDTYLACDVYYLDTVKEMFQDAVNISDTDVVIAVPKGNPKKIETLEDLKKEGIRVTVGQPDQCTIGVLTRKLLKKENVLDDVMKNVVAEKPTSAMLIPSVSTGAADATLAYLTDTLAEKDKVDAIRIDSAAAKAIQPFSIAKSSEHKELSRRLFRKIADSKKAFESAGFHWRLNGSDDPQLQGIPASTPPRPEQSDNKKDSVESK